MLIHTLVILRVLLPPGAQDHVFSVDRRPGHRVHRRVVHGQILRAQLAASASRYVLLVYTLLFITCYTVYYIFIVYTS